MIGARPYQVKAANEILASLVRHRNPLFVLPTRGGKTWVSTMVIGTMLGQGWKIGFFVHRRELIKQAQRAFNNAGIPFGLIMPGEMPTSHHLHIASIDTVVARLSAGDVAVARWIADLDLICCDEAHHAVSAKWLAALKRAARALLMGLTATAYRTDGQGLGFAGFDTPILGPSAPVLQEQSYLAPVRVVAPVTGLDFSKLKLRGADFALEDMQALLDNPDFIMAASRAYARYAPGEPCVVFSAGKDHADHIADGFQRAGWRARSVDGDDSEAYRDGTFAALAKGTIDALISCELVSEGVDMPAVSTAIMLRPSKSTQLFEQQAGRVRTAHENKTATVLVDLVGNTAIHGLPGSERPWTLEGGIKGLERQVEPTRRCIKCCTVHIWADRCTHCGTGYPRARGVHRASVWHLPGIPGYRPEQIAAMQVGPAAELAKSRRDLQRIAAIKGLDAGWVDRIAKHRGLSEVAA